MFGDHRDLPVLTHSFPTRRSSDLGQTSLLPDDAYGGTMRLARRVHGPAGLEIDAVDLTDLAAVEAAWRPETRMVWLETPSNPWLRIVDIEAISALAH